MQTVLQILLQLHANNTAFIQFFIFVITISTLTIFVYGPFFRAYDERLKQTKGADQVAGEAQDEAKKLETIYKTKAREINEKVSKVFDSARKDAGSAVETVLNQAKKDSAQLIEKARKEVETQKQNASKEVVSLSQELAKEITNKLTGAV